MNVNKYLIKVWTSLSNSEITYSCLAYPDDIDFLNDLAEKLAFLNFERLHPEDANSNFYNYTIKYFIGTDEEFNSYELVYNCTN